MNGLHITETAVRGKGFSVVHLKQQCPVTGVSKIGCIGQEIDFAYEYSQLNRLWPEVPVVRENRWTEVEMPSINRYSC